jgi:mRNA interferase RelE/StbE
VERYKIYFRKSAAKELDKLPKTALQKVIKRIELLSTEPRPSGSEKLTGQEFYRIRQGDYRIIYSIQDREVTIWGVKIGHRKDVYKQI